MEYFDYSGTAPLNYEIFKTVVNSTDFNSLFGNPSSNHNMGVWSKNILNKTRTIISDTLNCLPEEIIFTSGGTESDNMALFGVMYSEEYVDRNELIVSEIEHPAILNCAKELEKRGFLVKYVKVNPNGVIDINDLKNKISNHTRLVSIMSINNETGVIQPIKEIYKITRIYGALLHTDAVQAVGISDINTKYCDLLSLSGHKFGAFKGTGILYKRKKVNIKPIIFGGGQEQGLRSGTENVFGNSIMALCLVDYINAWNENKYRIKELRNYICNEIKEEFGDLVQFNGDINEKVCNNINLSFKNIDSQTLQLLLMNNNIDVSIGSACHSNTTEPEPSYVLTAMKVPNEYINGTLRITLGYNTDNTSARLLISNLIQCVSYLYKLQEL